MLEVVMLVCNDFRDDARVQRQAATLSQEGYSVTVLAHMSKRAPEHDQVLENGVRVRRFSIPFFGAWPAFRPMRKLLNSAVLLPKLFTYLCIRCRAHIFHAHDLDALIPAALAASIFKNKVIYDAHELITERATYKWLRPLLFVMEYTFCKIATHVVTTTDSRAELLMRKYSVNRPVVIPNLPPYRDVFISNKIRETLDIKSDKVIALYQGRLHDGRGIRTIIALAERIPWVNFVLVGEGPQQNLVDSAAVESKWDNLFRIPWVSYDRLHDFTCSADIGLQLLRNTCVNHYTTDSNKLFEYVSAGLPVLASDFPEISTVIKKYRLGRCCNPEDLNAIEQEIKAIALDRETLEKYKSNSRDCSKLLCWDAVSESFLSQLYGTDATTAL